MHYKSWLPGVAMARFGKQRYNNILDTFDEGTWVSSISNMGPELALDTEVHAFGFLTSVLTDMNMNCEPGEAIEMRVSII